MLTKEVKIAVALAAAQMMILAVVMAVYQPRISFGMIVCGMLVIAAEVVTFREVQAMGQVLARAPRRRRR